jgi:hypothetical protein
LDSTVSGQGPVAGCCECGDEPSGSCATELVNLVTVQLCNSVLLTATFKHFQRASHVQNQFLE